MTTGQECYHGDKTSRAFCKPMCLLTSICKLSQLSFLVPADYFMITTKLTCPSKVLLCLLTAEKPPRISSSNLDRDTLSLPASQQIESRMLREKTKIETNHRNETWLVGIRAPNMTSGFTANIGIQTNQCETIAIHVHWWLDSVPALLLQLAGAFPTPSLVFIASCQDKPGGCRR